MRGGAHVVTVRAKSIENAGPPHGGAVTSLKVTGATPAMCVPIKFNVSFSFSLKVQRLVLLSSSNLSYLEDRKRGLITQ